MKRPSSTKLRSLRLARGLDYVALSDATDVDRRTLSDWERRPTPYYSARVLSQLAEFYACRPDDLLEEITDEEAAQLRKPGRPTPAHPQPALPAEATA